MTRAVLPIPLGAMGLNAGPEPRLVQDGLLRLENGRWDRRGAISKRPGMDTVSTEANHPHLATWQDKPVLLGSTLKVRNATTSAWDDCGSLGLMDLSVDWRAVVPEEPSGVEVAAQGDVLLLVFTWYEDSAILANAYQYARAVTYSKSSGKRLAVLDLGLTHSAIAAPPPWPARAININGSLYCLKLEGNSLKLATVSAVDGSIGSWSTAHSFAVAPETAAGARWDCCVDGSTLVVAFADAAGDVRLGFLAGSMTEAVHAATTARAVGCFQLRSGVAGILFYDAGTAPDTVKCVGYNTATGAVAVTEITLDTAVFAVKHLAGVATSSTVAACYWTDATAASIPTVSGHDYRIRKSTFTDASGTGVAGTVSTLKDGCLIAARPWLDGTEHYLPVATDVGSGLTKPGGVVLNSSGVPVAVCLVGSQHAGESYHPGAPVATTGSAYFALPSYGRWFGGHDSAGWLKGAAPSDPAAGFGVAIVTLTTTDLAKCKPIDTGHSLVIPGALPREFEGSAIRELGFFQYPHKCSVAAGAGAGLGIGTYGYVWAYEAFDDRGRRAVSSCSPVASAVTTSGNQVVTIQPPPPLTLTLRQAGEWRAVLYRTLVGGSVYHRRAVLEGANAASWVAMADGLADADLETEEQLYVGDPASISILEHVQVPPFRVAAMHDGRLCVVPIEDDRVIWYSKPLLQSQAIHFCGETHSHRPVAATSEITALDSFFGRICAWTTSRLIMIEGAPLDNTGGGAGLGSYLLHDGVGCSDHRTVVQTPAGVLWNSNAGIRLLTRELQLVDIGERVKYHTDSLTVVRAVAQPDDASAIFLTSGSALELNTEQAIWSTRTNHEASDGCVAGGLLWVRNPSTGVVRKQVANRLDGGSAFSLLLASGHLSPANLGGKFRIKRLLIFAYHLSTHTLHCAFQYDGDPTWMDDQDMVASTLGSYFSSAALLGSGLASTYRDKAYVLEAIPSQDKCSSIAFRIYDASATGTDGGIEIVAAALEVDVKEGALRSDTVRRFT